MRDFSLTFSSIYVCIHIILLINNSYFDFLKCVRLTRSGGRSDDTSHRRNIKVRAGNITVTRSGARHFLNVNRSVAEIDGFKSSILF